MPVTEIFTVPKGSLQPVDVYAGKIFYTSPDLKRKYILAIEKSSKGSPIAKKIRELVKSSVITPVFKGKSKLRSIFKRPPIEFQGLGGMALPEKGKVYIFVEQDSNIFSFTSNNALASVTLHELIHLVAKQKANVFFQIFKKDLMNFYRFYFCKLLNCEESKISDSDMLELVKFVFYDLERGKYYIVQNKELKKYNNIIFSIFKEKSSLSDENFQNTVTQYIVALKLIQKLELYGKGHEIIRVATAYRNIVIPFYSAYKAVFNADPLKNNVLAYQEMFIPSEIISVQTIVKKPNQNIYKAISQL